MQNNFGIIHPVNLVNPVGKNFFIENQFSSCILLAKQLYIKRFVI